MRNKKNNNLNYQLNVFNIPALIKKLKYEDAWRIDKRNAITLKKNLEMHIVLVALHTGAEIKIHQVSGPISVQVIEGNLEFYTENDTVKLGKGELLSLGKNIRYGLKAVKESAYLLTMTVQASSQVG